jgi:protein-tyrosine phosphatase
MGNICRSPMAETVFRHLVAEAGLAGDVEIASAGTGGWHVGDGADRRALAALRDRGYDGSSHRARQFARDWFDRYDLVVALDRDNERALRSLAAGVPGADGKIRLLLGEDEVPDPYYGGRAGFDHVLDLVEEACRALVEEVRADVAG